MVAEIISILRTFHFKTFSINSKYNGISLTIATHQRTTVRLGRSNACKSHRRKPKKRKQNGAMCKRVEGETVDDEKSNN